MFNLFGRADGAPNPKVGTTTPLFVPKSAEPQPVNPGEYFWIKIHSSQAAFRGSIFQAVKQLVVTSVVNLNHPVLGDEDIRAIQKAREVQKDAAVQLGLSSNLISLVPATMTHVSVSIDFVLDKENHLAKLGTLINDGSFLTAISLAPGAAAVAKTVSGLAQKVIQTFIPAEESKPILQFSGDFNLGTEPAGATLHDGYYIILGSQDEANPLPTTIQELVVGDSALHIDGRPVTQLSYVVLDVGRSLLRTRKLSEGALWDRKLRDAESFAQQAADAPFAEGEDKKETWKKKCLPALEEARTLLQADANYAPGEADDIYKVAYKRCADILTGQAGGALESTKEIFEPADIQAERAKIGVVADAALDLAVADYLKGEEVAERTLRANGWL